MASYKERVAEDIDRWIAAGYVAPEQRDAILSSIPDARRLDAATALVWVGAILLGMAVIAFIAGNWEAMPRLVRFALLLLAFAACAGAAAWSARKARLNTANVLLMLASLIFAAAIGLTGQIFDIAGEPRTALYASGVAAAALALAGGSSGAAIAALAFFGVADFFEGNWFFDSQFKMPWLVLAAPLGALAALRWKSAALAHAASLGIVASFGWFATKLDDHHGAILLFLSIWMAILAYGGRWLREQEKPYGGVFFGWFTWGAIVFFAAAGYADSPSQGVGIAHRLVWLGLSGALVALGRHDRHALVTAAGVLSLLAAIFALMADLGLDLLTAAMLYFFAAIVALVIGLWLRGRRKAKGEAA